VDGVIAQRRTRRSGALAVRERVALALLAGSFVAASALLVATLDTTRHPNLLVVALYVVLYAVLSQVEFEIGSGAAIPTQLVLVPMLFVLPLSWVPPAIAGASLLRAGADVARGRRRLSRLPLALVNSWYAIGPVLVLAVAQATNPRWSAAPVYLAALAAQFAIDLAVARIWARSVGVRAAPLRTQGLSYLVDASLAPIGLLVAFAAVGRPYLILLVLPLVGLLSLFARERGQRIDAALELGHAYRGTALLLGDVVEADDAYTGEHSRDVVSLTIEVAGRLGLDARQARNAEFVALLHDVGKIRIPAQIINKPGPLDPDERAVIETHTVEGEAMLARVGGLLGEVGALVRSCHERWDGGGYPDQLAGERIPLIARIVCCADAFSAMTTDRPYRKALSVDEAVVELRHCAGTQFDPRVVDAVVAVARR
jgi:HD-GYP domain-containing protein (c-di-GMP phosphodiesterase class II)